MHLQENTSYDLDLKMLPSAVHIIIWSAKFEVVKCNGLGVDTFYKIFLKVHDLTLTLPRSDKMLPSSLFMM